MKAMEQIRLASHRLAMPEMENAADVVAWMGAVQAQDYRRSKWALGMRMKEGTQEAVHAAMREGQIVRTHILRPTWHWVAAEDLRWMWRLSAPRVRRAFDSWMKGRKMNIPEEAYSRSNDCIGRILEGGRHLTKEEIGVRLAEAGVGTDAYLLRCYLLRAEVEGVICGGADREGMPTYALMDEWVPAGAELVREEALARLARAYFRSHAPALLEDFVWWSGLALREAREAMGLLGDELVCESREGREFWMPAGCREAGRGERVHLLPPYDEYLVAYKYRDAVIALEHHARAFNRWGIFQPVVLCDGQVVGNWKESIAGHGAAIELFAGKSVDEKALCRAEERLRRFWE